MATRAVRASHTLHASHGSRGRSAGRGSGAHITRVGAHAMEPMRSVQAGTHPARLAQAMRRSRDRQSTRGAARAAPGQQKRQSVSSAQHPCAPHALVCTHSQAHPPIKQGDARATSTTTAAGAHYRRRQRESDARARSMDGDAAGDFPNNASGAAGAGRWVGAPHAIGACGRQGPCNRRSPRDRRRAWNRRNA